MSQRILGIDLGTTNTCVAVLDSDHPVVIPNTSGSRTTPSMVAYTEAGEVIVGQAAQRQAITNPTRTVHSIKRLMGQKPDDEPVTRLKQWLGYTVESDSDGRLAVLVDGEHRTPVEISAIILKAVKKFAGEYFGEECTDAVITCPAYFDEGQRQATADAGAVAGLNVLRIINEPTAASLAYGWGKEKNGVFVVYDWGGGTFDCSVVECQEGAFKVVSTFGDSFLGGNDMDERIIDQLAQNFEKEHGADLKEDPVALQRLREAAETAKIELSSVAETEIVLPFLYVDTDGPKHLQFTLKRTDFQDLVNDMVEATIEACGKVLADAELNPGDIEDILLVGGSTKIPIVTEKLEAFFGKPPRKGINADEAVAIGAAIQGGIIGGTVEEAVLLDVLPLSLGIATGKEFAPILRRGTMIPAYRSEVFNTTKDFQSAVRVRVYQGDHELVESNKHVGTFRLINLPPMRAGQVKITVSFTVDENGLLQVEARDPRTGLKQAVAIQDSLKLSGSEIDRLSKRVDEAL